MAVETEKKFLLSTRPPALFTNGLEICQGYMPSAGAHLVRVRIYGEKGYLTVKGPTRNGTRPEFEYEVPLSDARQMLELFCKKPYIQKIRHIVDYQGFTWEIDVFKGENDGLIVAEIELDNIHRSFPIPEWVGTEVTGDPRYFNSNLLRHPYKDWK